MLNAFTPVATLPTTDSGRSQKFYEDTLGLTVERTEEGGVFYKCGTGRLFVYPSQYAGTNKATAATLVTQDDAAFDSTVEALRKKGVKFMTFEYEGVSWKGDVATFDSASTPVRGAWFTDPDGNILALSAGSM